MISDSNDRLLTITFCSDGSGDGKTLQLVIPGKESEHSNSANKGEHCAFSGLAKVATGGADEILLMMAFAFILVLGLAPLQRQSNLQFFYLRPPLRGPPAVA
ncbi:hypothetical protein [Sphingorhabdus sp. 109]|uniref:hypothetical protein n=1 Tax=Sphingorhabdus sp. 109 TaxID=2653173 RepID=UPI00135B428A